MEELLDGLAIVGRDRERPHRKVKSGRDIWLFYA